MTREEIKLFEDRLVEHGYKKIYQCKATQSDDFEYYKAFYGYDDDYPIQYQIFFEFWDFEKYGDIPTGWSVSVTILPESCKNDVGRRDFKLSVDWSTDIERVERVAQKFYEFLLENVD